MNGRELLARLGGVVGRGRRDEELRQELELHRELLEERHRERGLSPAEARRAARLELGGETQTAEAWRDQRGLPAIDMLLQDVRYAVRILGRSRGFTIAALLTLALGIGSTAAIFTIVDAVLLRPLPYAAAERLVAIGERGDDGGASSVGYTTASEWRQQSSTLERLTLLRTWNPTLMSDGEAERIPGARVSWDYFEMLGVRPALGRGFTAADDRAAVELDDTGRSPAVNRAWRALLVSDGLWRRRFGADPAVLGRLVRMNDRDYRVVGVLPPTFEPLLEGRFAQQPAQMWATLAYDTTMPYACRSCQHLRAYARLRPGVTAAGAAAEISAIRDRQRAENPTDYAPGRVVVEPLRGAIAGAVAPALYVLFAAVVFVLLIACANVANLLLARSLPRHRELTLRTALGAGRGRLVRQLLTESLVLSLGGAALGVGLAWAGVRALVRTAPVTLPRVDQVGVDGRVLLFAAGLAVLTSLLFGLVPAWRTAGAGIQSRLASDSRTNVGGHGRGRAALVIVDLALALVLLAGSGVMLRSVSSLLRVDPGFDAARVLTLQLSLVGQSYAEDAAVVAFQQRLLERVRAVPGVAAAALAGQVPMGGNGDKWGFHVRGRMRPNPADDPSIERYAVTTDYFGILGIPLRRGRLIDDRDTAASEPVMVVSESTARAVWGGADPIGAKVRVGGPETGPWRTVVGIAGDVHHADLAAPPTEAMYLPQPQNTDSFLVLAVKTATSSAVGLEAPIRAAVRELDPAVPIYQVAQLSDLLDATVSQRRFVMRLLASFAVIALLLAAIGLYGVVSYGVAQRAREVGVRVALGARPRDVLRLVAGGGMLIVALGLAAGLAVAAAATRFLGALVFGVSSTDPLTFGAAAAALTAVALAAHWVPIRRALRIAPATALRLD